MENKLCLKKFNRYYKEMDIVYHKYAKKCGLSDMAFWILYAISESDTYFTQRDFCKDWFFSPQTVNSALKDLERKNIIRLEAVLGNKKNKWIKLTEEGEIFMQNIIDPLVRAECESFEILSKKECEIMLSAMQKYVYSLENKFSSLNNIISTN